MQEEFVAYISKLHGFRKLFVFLVWYDLRKYFFNIAFSYRAIHTKDMSMKYLRIIFI